MEDFKIDGFNKAKKVKLATTNVEFVESDVITSVVPASFEPDLFGDDVFASTPETEENVWEKAVNEENPLWEDFGLERNMRAMYPKSQYQK